VANHGQRRGVECLGDPELRARVRTAANQMVGELLAESRGAECLKPLGPESDAEFAAQLIDDELTLIADGAAPLRVALRIAFLQAAREALQALAAIRALPETASQGAGRSEVRRATGRCSALRETLRMAPWQVSQRSRGCHRSERTTLRSPIPRATTPNRSPVKCSCPRGEPRTGTSQCRHRE
jgi:hypothetical protein